MTKDTTTKKATQPTKKEDKATDSAQSMISENSKVTFKIEQKLVATTYQTVLKNFAKTTAAPGFRKGKAPLEIVESIVGRLKLLEKTFEKVAPNAYYDAVIKEKRHPLTNPEFNPLKLDMDADWEIEAFFAEKPTITLGDYKATVKKAIKSAQVEIEETAKAKKEKEAAEKDKKAESEAEKSEKVKEALAKQQAQFERETKLKHIFKELVATIKPTVPELLVRQETRYELDNLMRQLEQFGMKLEQYVARRQMTTEALSKELAATALGRLQLEFVLGAIANEQNYTASHDEVDQMIQTVTDEKLRAQLHENAEYRQQVEASVIRQKVIDFLLQ